MDDSLQLLEEKVERAVTLIANLRSENQHLRDRLNEIEGEKLALQQKIDGARTRLETLMERLPAE